MTEFHVPSVLFATDGGERHRLLTGDIIGRGVRCALPFEDPRISEAHAMLSLRDGGFWLLGLRGTVWNGRRWGAEVRIATGSSIRLAEGVSLDVCEVVLPTTLLALEGLGGDPLVLTHDTISVRTSPMSLRAGFEGDADAWIWSSEGQWRMRKASGEISLLHIGQAIALGPHALTVVGVPLGQGQAGETIRQRATHAPLTITVEPRRTTVACGTRSVVLVGRSHDIVRCTAQRSQAYGGAVHWADIAGDIWRANPTPDNWYHNCARLAAKLNHAGLPSDLLRMEKGLVSLALRPGIDEIRVECEPLPPPAPDGSGNR